jgi:hypothetical protein
MVFNGLGSLQSSAWQWLCNRSTTQYSENLGSYGRPREVHQIKGMRD